MGSLKPKNDKTPKAATNEVSNLSATIEETNKMSISAQISTINVPFHGDCLYLVSKNSEPYVPMKPVVEGMGLTWQSQHEKLKQRFSTTITEIVIVAADGKSREMTCLAFRKFAAWLSSINANKVKPEIRERGDLLPGGERRRSLRILDKGTGYQPTQSQKRTFRQNHN